MGPVTQFDVAFWGALILATINTASLQTPTFSFIIGLLWVIIAIFVVVMKTKNM